MNIRFKKRKKSSFMTANMMSDEISKMRKNCLHAALNIFISISNKISKKNTKNKTHCSFMMYLIFFMGYYLAMPFNLMLSILYKQINFCLSLVYTNNTCKGKEFLFQLIVIAFEHFDSDFYIYINKIVLIPS